MSEDDGATWSELAPAGDWGGIVVMGLGRAEAPDAAGTWRMFHDDGRFFAEAAPVTTPVVFTLYKTLSDGRRADLVRPEAVLSRQRGPPLRAGIVRSPDGRTLAALLRENRRTRTRTSISRTTRARHGASRASCPGRSRATATPASTPPTAGCSSLSAT